MREPADKDESYAYLSAGSVIRSYRGHANFPVRLGQEIFQRCLHHSPKKEDVVLYDPLCGTAYLLTVLGLLHFDIISTIYASDLDRASLVVAKQNLSLLTKQGIAERALSLQTHLDQYQRASYQQALAHIRIFENVVTTDKTCFVFEKDLFADALPYPIRPDVMIMDVPYDELRQWEGNYTASALAQQVAKLAQESTIVAIVRNRKQKLDLSTHFRRLEKFKVGKRLIEIYQKTAQQR